jgi:hypothetical protein
MDVYIPQMLFLRFFFLRHPGLPGYLVLPATSGAQYSLAHEDFTKSSAFGLILFGSYWITSWHPENSCYLRPSLPEIWKTIKVAG